ncbi:MAG: RDD family protein [Patescibacteria group bacterium]|nr:RDD family protein [Patescibacteria group bacterium]
MKNKILHLLIRLLAGVVDLLVSAAVLVIIIHTVGIALDDLSPGLAVFSCLALWFALISPILHATWGTTPGLWLTKTTLTHSQGKRLNLWTAYKRTLLAWVAGWGLGLFFPLSALLLVTNGILFLRRGKTLWDVSNDIGYGELGKFRVIALLVIVFTIMAAGLWVISQESTGGEVIIDPPFQKPSRHTAPAYEGWY